MTTKKLLAKLNKLSDKMTFSAKEFDESQLTILDGQRIEDDMVFIRAAKGEIWIYVKVDGQKLLLAKILPPINNLDGWSVDLSSPISGYEHNSLEIYIKALEIIDQFLADKEAGNE